MKLSWMFGPSMQQRHLLYVYLVVWLVQSGYCAWIAWQWMHTPKSSGADDLLSPANREDS